MVSFIWIFLSNVKISIQFFLFYRKKVREKVNFFKNLKELYFLLCGYFWHVFRHLSVLSKKCSFAFLGIIRQKLNFKSTLKLNGFWRLHGSFIESSFSWIFTNILAFQILRALHIFDSMQRLLIANSYWSN